MLLDQFLIFKLYKITRPKLIKIVDNLYVIFREYKIKNQDKETYYNLNLHTRGI